MTNSISLYAQIKKIGLTEADKSALEGVIVEKYYVAGKSEVKDTVGGFLPKGSVTYRIYIDMKPGYFLQAVYGVPSHELFIKTTTKFFNNKDYPARTGDEINDKKINENTVALDSWVSMGAATKSHFGILRSDDKDSSIITRKPLSEADGLIIGVVPKVNLFGLDLTFFDETKDASSFYTKNGSWCNLMGVKGTTPDNRVLIAQLTTDGKLSFSLNIQLVTPALGSVKFVAKDPEGDEIKFAGLSYK